MPQPSEEVPTDATANRINTQFFNSYPQPPLPTPQNIAAAPPVNGTPAQPVATSAAAPTHTYDPTHEPRGENGEAVQRPGFAAVNNGGPFIASVEGEANRAPAITQNGQAPYANQDTEMGDADDATARPAATSSFTAVNR